MQDMYQEIHPLKVRLGHLQDNSEAIAKCIQVVVTLVFDEGHHRVGRRHVGAVADAEEQTGPPASPRDAPLGGVIIRELLSSCLFVVFT